MQYFKMATAAFAAVCAATAMAADVKSGESIAFMGDSITAQGWSVPTGYVRMVEATCKANGIDATYYPAGISGHKSNQMLARLDKDVLSKKPTYMTLSCGVNDVWHGGNGVPLDAYKKNITEIVDKAQAAGIKVILLTSTMIREDVENNENKKLAGYNDFLRELAKEKNCKLADLSAEMIKQVAELRGKTGRKNNFLTTDGVHMDYAGNKMMADGVLRALGFTDAEIAKGEAAYLQLPYDINIRPRVTVEEYAKLQAKADAEKLSVQQLISREVQKLVK